MKLLVSWLGELSTYVTREFHFVMRDLIHIYGWRHVQPDVLSGDPASARAILVQRFGELPETILFWETYELCLALMPILRDVGCRGYLFADDLHLLWGKESMRDAKLLAFAGCDRILASYAYIFHEFYPELRGRSTPVWIPHSASPDFALPFNDHPENRILLSGAGGPHYPLRGRVKDLQEAGTYPIEHRHHPGYAEGYDYDGDSRVGVGYAKTIHRYKVGFTDASIFRYAVAKYFEIPATGSLLLAGDSVREPLAELGFIENVHYIPVCKEDLERKIEYVLDPNNDDEIHAIRRRGQELVLSRHRTRDRAKLIDSVA
jgi:hypothetical protein